MRGALGDACVTFSGVGGAGGIQGLTVGVVEKNGWMAG